VVVLRATKKVLRSLSLPVETSVESSTALGDWYVNRIVVARQPLLLLVSAASLLSMLEPARQVRTLPDRLSLLVADRLERLGVNSDLIRVETCAMEQVAVATTIDRSVLGTMNDFAKAIPFYLGSKAWDSASLLHVETRLWETPCRVTRRLGEAIYPARDTQRLLLEKWKGEESSGVSS
jgi:hypothetical protein